LIDENLSLAGLCDMPIRNIEGRREVDGVALARILREWEPDFVTVERVWGRAHEGGKSAFSFGKCAGTIVGCLSTLGIGYIEVAPSTWMSVILRGRTEEGKARSLAWAKEHFPTAELETKRGRLLDGRSDAICLACYGFAQARREAA
jgi:hypothetical protein